MEPKKITDLELTSTIREAWSLFESDIYSWKEFCQKLNGGKPETDVESFIEEVFKPRMRLTAYMLISIVIWL